MECHAIPVVGCMGGGVLYRLYMSRGENKEALIPCHTFSFDRDVRRRNYCVIITIKYGAGWRWMDDG